MVHDEVIESERMRNYQQTQYVQEERVGGSVKEESDRFEAGTAGAGLQEGKENAEPPGTIRWSQSSRSKEARLSANIEQGAVLSPVRLQRMPEVSPPPEPVSSASNSPVSSR